MAAPDISRAVRFLKRKDKNLGRVIDQIGPLDLNRRHGSGFQALVSIVVGQQLSGKAARAIFKRLAALSGKRTISPACLKAVTDEQLRQAGLSAAKVRSIRDLLERIDNGSIKVRSFSRMSDQEVFDAITQVKGFGPWSAQMYLMFVLQRLDIFAPGDLGIRKAIVGLYGVNPEKTDFEAFSERWKPYRTVACWYLWRSLATAPLPNDKH